MKMNWLYDFNKWPESIPIYKLGDTQHFHFAWVDEIGFDKHVAPITKAEFHPRFEPSKQPCYPVESKIENS